MANRRIALIGASHSEIPLAKAAVELGYDVHCVASSIADSIIPYARGHMTVNYSDRSAVLSACQSLDPVGVCAGANDFAYLSAAFCAEQMALPGYDSVETAEKLHLKHQFKGIADEIGLPVCKTVFLHVDGDESPITSIPPDVRFPLIVKPVDLTGGKGISLVREPNELHHAITDAKRISKRGEVLVEEFFDGSLHCYDAVVVDGSIVFEHTDNEYSTINPFLVSVSCCPGVLPDWVREEMRSHTSALIKHLCLADGILHCQLLWNGEEYRILEYTRRCSGDLYSLPVSSLHGVDHARMILAAYLGERPDPRLVSDPSDKFYSRYCVHSETPGVYREEQISNWAQACVIQSFPILKTGHVIMRPLVEKTSVHVLRFDSYSEFLEFFSHARQSHFRVVVG